MPLFSPVSALDYHIQRANSIVIIMSRKDWYIKSLQLVPFESITDRTEIENINLGGRDITWEPSSGYSFVHERRLKHVEVGLDDYPEYPRRAA